MKHIFVELLIDFSFKVHGKKWKMVGRNNMLENIYNNLFVSGIKIGDILSLKALAKSIGIPQ